MDKILIVDGHNLLFQMFYGMPNVIIGKNNKKIQGTLGFIGALLKIINLISPTHVLVLFDSENREIRNDIYSEYKATRMDFTNMIEEETPFSQLDDIYKALDFLNIKYMEVVKYEVDDVIASYCIKLGCSNEIVISSFDSDFFQLINKNISILRYRGSNTIICDERYVVSKFGVTPDKYALFKSLTGDKADNIKGICRIGVKTASKLVNEYENIETLISNINNIEREVIRNELKSSVEQLKRNYKLIKLNDIAPIPFEKEQLIYENKQIKTNDVLTKIGVR